MSEPMFDNVRIRPSMFYGTATGVLRFVLQRYHSRSRVYSAVEYQIHKRDLDTLSNHLTVDSRNRLRYGNVYIVRFNAFDDYTARELDTFVESIHGQYGRRLPDEKVPVRGKPSRLPASFAALMA